MGMELDTVRSYKAEHIEHWTPTHFAFDELVCIRLSCCDRTIIFHDFEMRRNDIYQKLFKAPQVTDAQTPKLILLKKL